MTGWLLAAAVLLAVRAGRAQVLDRVAASVGTEAITEQDVTTECRFESFLEGRVPPREYGAAARKAAVDRLVSQALLREQLAVAKEENASNGEATEEVLDGVRKRFAGPADYEAAVRALGMSESEIAERIASYEQMLEMIDERFRPVAHPSEEETAKYYQSTFEPEYRRAKGAPAPPLKEVEKEIREILVQQDINQLLQGWLNEMRATEHVKIEPTD